MRNWRDDLAILDPKLPAGRDPSHYELFHLVQDLLIFCARNREFRQWYEEKGLSGEIDNLGRQLMKLRNRYRDRKEPND